MVARLTRGAPTQTIAWRFKGVVMWSHVTNSIHYISTCRRPMGTKLRKVLTYRERLPPLKPRVLLIPWPTEAKRQFKTFLFPLSQDIWPLNLARCLPTRGGSAHKRLSHHQLLVNFMIRHKWPEPYNEFLDNYFFITQKCFFFYFSRRSLLTPYLRKKQPPSFCKCEYFLCFYQLLALYSCYIHVKYIFMFMIATLIEPCKEKVILTW